MLDTATVLTTMFTYIDDYCKQHTKIKPGPKPKLSDSEVITIALCSELAGKTSEYAHVAYVNQWLRDYFPHMIDRSRYHRRLRHITRLINDVRTAVLKEITMALTDIHIIDSTPLPVITFQRAYYTPLFPEASFGYCSARNMTYYGFKLHLVTDNQGIPVHFDLTPANIADVDLTEELLTYRHHIQKPHHGIIKP